MPGDRIQKALEEFLIQGIAEGVAPGMSCAVGTAEAAWFGYAGNHSYDFGSPSVGAETLWDIASLTKIVATTNVAMAMFEVGAIDLDDRVQRTILEFVGEDKHEVTLRHLLTHTSGLPAYGDFTKYTNALEVKDEILRTELVGPPGQKEEYTCLGFVALAEHMERTERLSFDQLFARYVAGPLKLQSTTYKPSPQDRKRCAPTERLEDWRRNLQDLRGFQRVSGEFIQGSVHDPIAYLIGGVSGNAGLFSNVQDLAKVAQAWLVSLGSETRGNNGSAVGRSPFSRSIVEQFSTPTTQGIHALGFDTKSPTDSQAGTRFSRRTFGHTGYTGTRIWVDPESGKFAVLLTNRVHPTADNMKIKQFSPAFFDFAYDLF